MTGQFSNKKFGAWVRNDPSWGEFCGPSLKCLTLAWSVLVNEEKQKHSLITLTTIWLKFEEEIWILLYFGTFFFLVLADSSMWWPSKKNGDRMIRTNPENTENQKYRISFQVKLPKQSHLKIKSWNWEPVLILLLMWY